MAWVNLGVAAIGAYGAVESSKNKAKAGGGGMPSMGMETDARSVNAIFDNSGWNVAFAGAKIDSTAEKSQSANGASVPNSPSLGQTVLGQQPGAGLGIDPQFLIYGAIGLLLVMAWKKKSS